MPPTGPREQVLVTGASGFIAAHTILHLLDAGYQVRGTLRDLRRSTELAAQLAQHSRAAAERLTFVQADLLHDKGWDLAAHGCRAAIHIASPFPLFEPEDPADLVRPAVEGTLRLLRAAAQAGMDRVVLLSSTAAMMYGHQDRNRTFTEADWSKLDSRTSAYTRSKTLQERAAWDFVRSTPRAPELVSINPPYVFGPLLDAHPVTSGELIRVLLAGERPGVAPVLMPFADVRDVAAVMVRAIEAPEAAGQRFLCTGHILPMPKIARILANHYAPHGRRIPTRVIPAPLLRLSAFFDRRLRLTLVGLGWQFENSVERARLVLGWQPRPAEETILAMAESMLRVGLVR